MRVVVTGVAGFIGSHIADRMLREGHEVIGIDDMSAGYKRNVPKGVYHIYQDICDIKAYSDILEGVDGVFHNAASKKTVCMANPSRDIEVNAIGTLRLLEECVKHGVKKFIHASTGSVYGETLDVIREDTPKNPISYYGISKNAGENYVSLIGNMFDIRTTILRYFHVWGDRQESKEDRGGVISIFDKKIGGGKPITIHGDGLQQRVFTHVSDVVEANLLAYYSNKAEGKIYNCCSDKRFSVIDAASMLMKKHGREVKVNHTESLIGDIYNINVDNSKIREDLGMKFHPFDYFF
jgi:nucleoside-diphosphate-sugar epimerase